MSVSKNRIWRKKYPRIKFKVAKIEMARVLQRGRVREEELGCVFECYKYEEELMIGGEFQKINASVKSVSPHWPVKFFTIFFSILCNYSFSFLWTILLSQTSILNFGSGQNCAEECSWSDDKCTDATFLNTKIHTKNVCTRYSVKSQLDKTSTDDPLEKDKTGPTFKRRTCDCSKFEREVKAKTITLPGQFTNGNRLQIMSRAESKHVSTSFESLMIF